MSNEEFCKLDTEFYGEVVDNVKQIKYRSFTGEELKEYVEHCIKLKNLGVIADVMICKVLEDFRNKVSSEEYEWDGGKNYKYES